jgi:hypothetical protein
MLKRDKILEMKFIPKLFLFLIIFSSTFWMFRTIDHGKILKVDLIDLGGIPWLYSAISLVFSILAAFTIQKEWDQWNDLVEATKEERNILRELWIWSNYLSRDNEQKIIAGILKYLSIIVQEWPRLGQGESSEEGETRLDYLRNTIMGLTEKTQRLPLLSLFNDLVKNRNKRIFQSGSRIPPILKNTLIFADFLMIILSLLIGVKNPFLDYIFTLSIGVLTYTIYIVIDDLDNPFRPGTWHLTPRDYQNLLDKINKTQ